MIPYGTQVPIAVRHVSMLQTSIPAYFTCLHERFAENYYYYYIVNHKKDTLFILGITWPNVDQTLQYLAEM